MNKNREIIKEAFDYAKLSLFNIRLMDDLQNSKEKVIQKLISSRAKADNLTEPIALLHQTTFLTHGYICLVWLWEKAKRLDIDTVITEKVGEHFSLEEIQKVKGPRELQKSKDFLRLIRNAISHGRVDVDDHYFYFSDIDEKADEKEETIIKITWKFFGVLSDTVLCSLNEYLYPDFYKDK